VKANPALLSPDEAAISVGARMQRLIYGPFKAVVQRGTEVRALSRGPLLIVLDGLDECDNKDEVQELIDGMLLFFDENPLIPLRVFITSRVEQHIKSHLNVPGVQLDDLVDHCSDGDIDTFLQVLFKDGCSRDSVVQAYVKQHGEWPSQCDRLKLVAHIGGSFIFASEVFKFIMGLNNVNNHPTIQTPMDRLPLALEMNPGLDGLYAQTLARSEYLPYFPEIISTIALLETPLPTAGIAELLGIKTYEVVNVLARMQAIVQVPGTDDLPVTLCHTSLREFLTTPSRSGQLCAQQSHHVRLFLRCLECQVGVRLQTDLGSLVDPKEFRPAIAYSLRYSLSHLISGQGFFKLSESNRAIQLCREAAKVSPGTSYSIHALANVVYSRARHTGSLTDLGYAIGLYREALNLRRPHDPDCPSSLAYLANALLDRYWRTGTMGDLEQAILLYRRALSLQTFPHAGRLASLFNFGNALLERYRCKQVLGDLEEAIVLHREALTLRPSPHPDRPLSLNNLGNALLDRYRRTRSMADLEEAISLHRQAMALRSPPHPGCSDSLNNLGNALLDRYWNTRTLTDLEEAISLFRNALGFQLSVYHRPSPAPLSNLVICLRAMYEESRALPHLVEAINGCQELLDSYYPFGHANRVGWLERLAFLVKVHFDATGEEADLTYIASLEEEASQSVFASAP
jgi:tetratricopeptide (TPR) repeat protein